MSGIQWSRVSWGKTILLNLERSFCAGVIWFAIFLALGTPIDQVLPMLALPVAYFFFMLPAGLIYNWLLNSGCATGSFALGIWIIITFWSLIVAAGDPVMWLLFKIIPVIIPTANYKFFAPVLIRYVID